MPGNQLLRTASPAALLACLVAATGAAPAQANTGLGAGAAATAATRTVGSAPAPVSTPLTLINGDRVLVSRLSGGAPTAVVLSAPDSALARSLTMLRVGTREYLVPSAALPFLGHGLDPRLFDPSALQAAEHGGRLPVTISYQGGQPVLPGITVTRRGGGVAQGYLTASSARVFGAALARQVVMDHSRGRYGAEGMFANGLSVSLPGTGPAPARPAFPMHVLTMTGTSLGGRPDTGDAVDLFNVNDPAALGESGFDASQFNHGTAKFTVPSGTYWAVGTFLQSIDHGRSLNVRAVILPQFTVAGNTSVRVAEQAANSKVAIVTPRPAVCWTESLEVLRAAHGAVTGYGQGVVRFGNSPCPSLLANRVSRHPSAGTLRAFTSGQLSSRSAATAPYGYSLDFAAPPGTIPRQRYVVHRASLAVVSERFYQDHKSTGGWYTQGGTASQLADTATLSSVIPLRLPESRIQYTSARPAMLWQGIYVEDWAHLTGGQFSDYQVLHAGQHVTQDWNRYPLHAAPNVSLPGSIFPAQPSALRAGNTLSLSINPFTDNQLGHIGAGFGPGATGSYALYRNGMKIAAGNALKALGNFGSLSVQAAVSPRPSMIKFVVNASRAGKQYPLSAVTRDVWTWPSRREPDATVPPPWYCSFAFTDAGSVRVSRRCAVQPMLMLRYRVAGLSLAGTTRPGRQVLMVTVAPLQHSAPSRVIGARVRVSFNGGRTWQAARVSRTGAAQFRALFTAPRSRMVTLQVTTHDAPGAAVTETIQRAYRIAP